MARKNRPGLIAGFLLLSAGLPACGEGRPQPGSLRVCVYYDAGRQANPKNGRIHAVMLENLLGHFREASVSLLAVGKYRERDLDRCDRAAYIGDHFDEPLPRPFLRDAGLGTIPFLWLNYNAWQVQREIGDAPFMERAGFLHRGSRGFTANAGADGVPVFFRYFDYKGERFEKLAFVGADGKVVAAPEILSVSATDAEVLATAVSTDGSETTPYATRKGNFFFVADEPFVYLHEQDRYLILADLLFDFLGLAPRSESRYAVLRLEDVHPEADLTVLERAVDVLKSRGVPFEISLIPKFVPAGEPESAGISMTDRLEFLQSLRRAQENGATLLLHGYTHNAPELKDCPPLASGADFEFWDRCRQAPLPYDSADFAAERVGKARALLAAAGLTAAGWVTPHYAASPADLMAFGRLFDRTLQRVRYELDELDETGHVVFADQFFPYTIFRDHYGQFVWPENLGFVPQPGSGYGGHQTLDIAATAHRTWVIRDSWASFYWHPQLMNAPGEPERLARMIDEIRAQGYRFVSLADLRARGE